MDSRHRIAIVAGACVAAGCAGRLLVPPLPDGAPVVLVGDYIFEGGADGADGETIGGLSGAWYDRESNLLLVVSDDRDRPRLVTLSLEIEPMVRFQVLSTTDLQPPGKPGRTLDAEGIAPAANGRVFIASEGERSETGSAQPGIFEYSRTGAFVRALPLPPAYVDDGSGRGMRSNGALEALTVSPDGRYLYAAVEDSLQQDGDVADFDQGTVVRLLAYDLRRPGAVPREYAYRTEPVERPVQPVEATGNNGVAELLALGPGDLLVLERGYVEEASVVPRWANTIRLYRVRLDEAAEVTGRASLADDPPRQVLGKRLVLDVATVAPQLSDKLRGLENFEALSFGPTLADGSGSLLLLSDDNFSSRQVTALVVLRFPARHLRR